MVDGSDDQNDNVVSDEQCDQHNDDEEEQQHNPNCGLDCWS